MRRDPIVSQRRVSLFPRITMSRVLVTRPERPQISRSPCDPSVTLPEEGQNWRDGGMSDISQAMSLKRIKREG